MESPQSNRDPASCRTLYMYNPQKSRLLVEKKFTCKALFFVCLFVSFLWLVFFVFMCCYAKTSANPLCLVEPTQDFCDQQYGCWINTHFNFSNFLTTNKTLRILSYSFIFTSCCYSLKSFSPIINILSFLIFFSCESALFCVIEQSWDNVIETYLKVVNSASCGIAHL